MFALTACSLFLLRFLPTQGTSSALIAVFIRNDCLAEAQSEYKALRAAGQWPHVYALNALLNAYAIRFRCGSFCLVRHGCRLGWPA